MTEQPSSYPGLKPTQTLPQPKPERSTPQQQIDRIKAEMSEYQHSQAMWEQILWED